MEEYQGDDFPAGAVVSYRQVAEDRLKANSGPAIIVSKDPRIIDLTRELTYLSDGKVTFQGRHKVALGGLLETYTPEELTEVFKIFIETKDLEDSYTLKYVTQNFLDAADGLAYTSRKKKAEAETERSAREATVLRLQKEAEEERNTARAREQEETFDPLSE
jgi:hypothetical protein